MNRLEFCKLFFRGPLGPFRTLATVFGPTAPVQVGAARVSKPQQRMEVLFTGHVQGVGFRYTACSIAEGIGVTGFVENLGDGRVRLVIEGACEEVDCCVAATLDRMQGYVRHTQATTSEATGEFCDFRVRY